MNAITQYFNAEKFESLFFILIGVLAMLVGFYSLSVVKTSFARGMAIPLLVLALVQVIVGTTVYVRSPKDVTRVERYVNHKKEKLLTEEIPRMQVVMKNFLIYRYVELACIVLALLMMFVWNTREFVQGMGIGLFIQASFMLALDFFAEKRGHEYLHFLVKETER